MRAQQLRKFRFLLPAAGQLRNQQVPRQRTVRFTLGRPVYTFSSSINTALALYASSLPGTNTSTIKNTLRLVLAEYNPDGSLHDFKNLDESIFRCYLNGEDLVNFQSYGLQFYKTCSSPRTLSTTYFYDVYVVDADGTYAEVPILIAGTYYKRFRPAVYNSISLELVSIPPLQTPSLSVSNQSPAVVRTNSTSATTTLNYMPFLAIFAVGIVVVFLLDFYRYLKYNPDENNDPYYCFKVILLFLIHVVKYVAMGIWLWVLALSTFIFCFYKFQQTVFIILPSPATDTTGIYKTFEAFFYITFSFTIAALVIMIFRLANSVDYFLIDWEKEKEMGKFELGQNKQEVSVWRRVLVVN
jgi:hypothetical protein